MTFLVALSSLDTKDMHLDIQKRLSARRYHDMKDYKPLNNTAKELG
jgi:hypothetical protein